MLPGNRIISTPSGTFKFLNADGMETTQLMQIILKAVSRHLQSSEV
jgi:hypothetical protein